MALFKISKGLKSNLPETKTEGYCWYTTDDSLFYIDYKDEEGVVQRKTLNAKNAETLMGASLETILNMSDVEIPTSKAVLDAIAANKVFIAVQNSSTWDEVKAAINAGNFVIARSGNTFYALTNYDSSIIRFSRAYQSTTSHITLNTSDKWAAGSTTHAKSTHAHDDITALISGHAADTSNPHNVTAEQVGADAAGTAETKVDSHNTSTTAHSDIRGLITDLTNRLNTLADSDDATLDQLSEVVDYIKDNRDLIDAITTSKVSVSDIVDNLTTNVSNKPLSAAQGVALKALIDEAGGATAINATLLASGWVDGKQRLTIEGITAESNGVIGITQDITAAQMEAAKAAELYACGQGEGTLTIAAFGGAPAVDIPVVLILMD